MKGNLVRPDSPLTHSRKKQMAKYATIVIILIIAIFVPKCAIRYSAWLDSLSSQPHAIYELAQNAIHSVYHLIDADIAIAQNDKTMKRKRGLCINAISQDKQSLLWFWSRSSPVTHRAVIFDAGSTGSRVHIYSFSCGFSSHDRPSLILDGERFEYITPGLSSYSHNITRAVDSLRPLVDIALQEVSEDEDRAKTPIFLRATAGLRLMSHEAADDIIAQINDMLAETPFMTHIGNHDSSEALMNEIEIILPASIMSGLDEGIYAWFTVNFLLGQLHDPKHAGVTLDMGGGSTQITFTPRTTETMASSPPGYIRKRLIDGEWENMYSVSYLGFGLMSARKAILAADPSSHVIPPSSIHENEPTISPIWTWFWPKDNPTTSDKIIIDRHPCFSNSKPKNWTYDGILYMINHASDAELSSESEMNLSSEEMDADFSRCMSLAREFVSRAQIDAPAELNNRNIYALSYFFDRSRDAGLVVGKGSTQARVKLSHIQLAAEAACTRSWPATDRIKSFLCLDLSYIIAYLHDGLKLNLDKEIHLVKKIDGIETSWALGAALDLLQHL